MRESVEAVEGLIEKMQGAFVSKLDENMQQVTEDNKKMQNDIAKTSKFIRSTPKMSLSRAWLPCPRTFSRYRKPWTPTSDRSRASLTRPSSIDTRPILTMHSRTTVFK